MLSALRFFLIEQSGYCRSYPRNRRLRTETVADFEVSLLWHIRTDNDPAQAWFRDVVAEAVAALRTGRRVSAPRRMRFPIVNLLSPSS
jgi:hypothetical protein